jgi:AraC-like DNA-binding protein
MSALEPLKAFRHIQTTNVAVLEELVRRQYTGAKFELTGSVKRISAIANRYRLNNMALAYSSSRAQLRIEIPGLEQYALLFAFRGRARARAGRNDVDIWGRRAFIGSAAESVRLDYGSDFEHLILSINPTALALKLEALTGDHLKKRLAFEHTSNFERRESEALRRMIIFLIEQADSRSSNFHPPALAEFEQALLVSFLSGNQNNYSHLLHRRPHSAALGQVHRAEDYIRANWDQPLTVEALALVAGVGTRSLFLAFQKTRGYSPMDFVKRIRLTHAKDMLTKAGPGASVTNVAFACGFGNLGHFSNYYRRRFGELPSNTLQRSLRKN